MEVLTIVAYNQPVSKGFVEHVRGVDSSSVVNTLVEKELLMEAGRLDVPGKPIAYATTPHFLRCFGLQSLEELPPLPVSAAPQETRQKRPKKPDHTHGVAQRRRAGIHDRMADRIGHPGAAAGTAAVTAGVCLRL